MSICFIDCDCFHNNNGNFDTDADTYYDSCYHWYSILLHCVSVLRYRLRIGRATLRLRHPYLSILFLLKQVMIHPVTTAYDPSYPTLWLFISIWSLWFTINDNICSIMDLGGFFIYSDYTARTDHGIISMWYWFFEQGGICYRLCFCYFRLFQIHPPLSTASWDIFDYAVASFYCDRYTSSGTTQTSDVVPASIQEICWRQRRVW